MTRPKLILPSLSMDWGRWVEENVDASEAALLVQQQDSRSAGNVFASRANLLQGQIAAIPSVAAIYSRQLPRFTVTRTSTGAVNYVYGSSPQTFNPPRSNTPYNYTVISSVDVSGVPLPFCRSLLRTNGVDNMFQHENLQPGYLERGTFSISGSGSIGPGDSVTVETAIATASTGTMTFESTNIWCLFSGSIL